jgi:hypothetical protein
MKWHRVKDELPGHEEEVLIRVEGIFNLAVFDEKQWVFVIRDGVTMSADRPQLQWLRLSDSEQR